MVIESVCQNRIGVRLAWDFFKVRRTSLGTSLQDLFLQEHLKEFFSRYGHGLFLMSKLIKCVTENFSTEEELTEVLAPPPFLSLISSLILSPPSLFSSSLFLLPPPSGIRVLQSAP